MNESVKWWFAVLGVVLGCGGRTELSSPRDADVHEEDAQVSLCAGDAGTLSTFIADAAMGPECNPFFANVVVENTGYSWIGPITVETLYVPSTGASWPVSSKGTTPLNSGGKFVLPVTNPGSCAPMSCPSVEIEIEIAGTGIPLGTRACGLATIGGC